MVNLTNIDCAEKATARVFNRMDFDHPSRVRLSHSDLRRFLYATALEMWNVMEDEGAIQTKRVRRGE